RQSRSNRPRGVESRVTVAPALDILTFTGLAFIGPTDLDREHWLEARRNVRACDALDLEGRRVPHPTYGLCGLAPLSDEARASPDANRMQVALYPSSVVGMLEC